MRQVILYLFGTYEKAYIEAQLGTAFTALECLISSIRTKGNDEINCFIDKDDFNPLLEKVEKIIRNEILDEKIANKLISGFKNSRQNSLSDRLWKLLQKDGVNITILWPAGTDTQPALRSLHANVMTTFTKVK